MKGLFASLLCLSLLSGNAYLRVFSRLFCEAKQQSHFMFYKDSGEPAQILQVLTLLFFSASTVHTVNFAFTQTLLTLVRTNCSPLYPFVFMLCSLSLPLALSLSLSLSRPLSLSLSPSLSIHV
jgi:hypothetical protein